MGHVPDLAATNVIPAVLGGFIVIYGLVSMFIKQRLFLSEALVATIYGIIIGPICLDLVDPANLFDSDRVTHEFSRYVIALQVMAAGIELPKAYIWKEWRSMTMLLLPVMTIMWGISAVIIKYIFILPWLDALIIAACVTPTDPILANSVVKGRFAEEKIPVNVRHILSAESGSNDGLGLPLMYLAIYLKIYPDDVGFAVGKWFYWVWGYEVIFSTIIGIIIGFGARKILYWAQQYDLIDKESFISYSIALTLFVLGVVGLLASDDLLSVFVAGTVFAWDDWFQRETEEAHLQEVVDMLFNITIFIYFGTIIPWHMFNVASLNLDLWRFFVSAILIFLFRRIPVLAALWKVIPAIRSWRESLFAGWFGPIGVGAMFYITVAREMLEDHQINTPAYDTINPIVSFMVLCSVILHGITIPMFLLGNALHTRTLSHTKNLNRFVSRLPKPRGSPRRAFEPEKLDSEAPYTITRLNTINGDDNDPSPSDSTTGWDTPEARPRQSLQDVIMKESYTAGQTISWMPKGTDVVSPDHLEVAMDDSATPTNSNSQEQQRLRRSMSPSLPTLAHCKLSSYQDLPNERVPYSGPVSTPSKHRDSF
ncbi:hypothetical protein H4R34_001990 [Dimargaris verticillata]|uniref:Cation/H+ exchanger transmembrane domain-containing protein n=1 Tax=Dimargaris verticillata TaxID=2761393 RepID=A0A9W8BAA7_9FUNG|nr:hypothetical protein H4R34_001990 [Dimargaris verticillata]